MPKISVIMGVYNTSNYNILKAAIDSILTQTYDDFEFIICDDGSSDNTIEMIQKLIKADARCRLIKNKKNCGLAQTLNNCIKVANGEYIARMDADDVSLPNRLKVQVDFLEKNNNIGVVGTQAYFIDASGKRYKEFRRPIEISKIDTIKSSRIIHPSVMMRKSVLETVNYYTVNNLTTRAEDYDLWCKITAVGIKICNLSDFLFEYREDLESLKKRKYKYRIDEFKIKLYWMRREHLPKSLYIFAVKPLFVGLIPRFIMGRRKIK